MKQDIILFQILFFKLKMDKKFQQVMLLLDFQKKQQKRKILLEDYRELLSYLKQEKQKIVQ